MKNHIERSVQQFIIESGEERAMPFTTLNITESGIRETSFHTETIYKWAAIFKKVEASNCYYLYTNSRQAVIIPKRIFSSVQEKEAFDKMLLQYIPLNADFPS